MLAAGEVVFWLFVDCITDASPLPMKGSWV